MIRDKILNILSDISGTNEIKNNPDIELFTNDLLDSFGIIELFIAIKEQLNIEIAPTEVDREMWSSTNKIIHYF